MGSKFCAESVLQQDKGGRDYLHVYRGLENSIHPDRMEHGLRGCARIETAELLHCINVHMWFYSIDCYADTVIIRVSNYARYDT